MVAPLLRLVAMLAPRAAARNAEGTIAIGPSTGGWVWGLRAVVKIRSTVLVVRPDVLATSVK